MWMSCFGVVARQPAALAVPDDKPPFPPNPNFFFDQTAPSMLVCNTRVVDDLCAVRGHHPGSSSRVAVGWESCGVVVGRRQRSPHCLSLRLPSPPRQWHLVSARTACRPDPPPSPPFRA
ncbi:hypothetical protein BGW80DRAFT_1442919 [Lactifluus volemus]|nr:hypothetical protein BGW80DRAFT_1442919 [Lactifluus volemus]